MDMFVGVRRKSLEYFERRNEADSAGREEQVRFRTSFARHKCCHPQISNLVFDISRWHPFVEFFLQILTSFELHSYDPFHPNKLLSHGGSLEVNLLMIFLELFLKEYSQKTII